VLVPGNGAGTSVAEAVVVGLEDKSAVAVAFESVLELGVDCDNIESVLLADTGLTVLPQTMDEMSCWL
jgi:hypothetical protein